MSGEQPSDGGRYTEIQAGPPAHAPAPQISAVSTLHNPFFVTGLVGGDEQTPSSVPSSLPWSSQPTAAEDTASLQCPLLRFYPDPNPDPTDETDSMLPARSFEQTPPTHTPMFSFRDVGLQLTSGLRVGPLPTCGPFAARPAPPPPATVAMDADMNPDSETMDPDMEAAIEAACAVAELEAACMNGEREAEEEEREVEYRRNEEVAANEEDANEEDADTRQAQLINPGLSGDEADSMLSDRKRTASSCGSSSGGEDSSDEGAGGGKKKKIRKRMKKKKKTSAAAAADADADAADDDDDDDDDDVRRKNLIGFIGLKNYHKSHATMPTEQLHLVWSKIKQWDELLLKFYVVQGARGSGQTRKKKVRSRLAALEQRMRELAQEKIAIEEGDHDHMQECVEADNAELSNDQMLSAAAGDAKRLVGSGVRELAAELLVP